MGFVTDCLPSIDPIDEAGSSDPIVHLNHEFAMFRLPPRPLSLPHLARYFDSTVREHQIVFGKYLSIPDQMVVLVYQISASLGSPILEAMEVRYGSLVCCILNS